MLTDREFSVGNMHGLVYQVFESTECSIDDLSSSDLSAAADVSTDSRLNT